MNRSLMFKTTVGIKINNSPVDSNSHLKIIITIVTIIIVIRNSFILFLRQNQTIIIMRTVVS